MKKKLAGKGLKRNAMKMIIGGGSGVKNSQCFDFCMNGCTHSTHNTEYCLVRCKEICG